jgi:hypothetical protein
LSDATLATLTNLEVIAVDQDPLGALGTEVAPNVYAKPLGNFTAGQYAVLLLNRSGAAASITVNWTNLGLVSGSSASVRDLWAHQDLGNYPDGYTSPGIPSHGSMMLKIEGPFDWDRARTYEAESSYNTVAGTAYVVPQNNNFSATAYVTGVGGGAANTLQFNGVAAPSNDLYEVDLHYASATDCTAEMSLNGGAATTLSFPATGGNTTVGSISIYQRLSAGENTLRFSNSSNRAPNFDKLVVSLGTPSNLKAVGDDIRITLTWTAPMGASFNVYRGLSSGGQDGTPIATGLTQASYVDTDLVLWQTYYYTVSAVDPIMGRESLRSAEASAKLRVATSSSAYESVVVSTAPMAYWRFSETNGTVAADSVGSFNGSYGSTVTLGGAGPHPPDFLGFETTNRAPRFPVLANNAWVTIPALNLNTNTVTLTCWVYPAAAPVNFEGLVFCRSNGTCAGLCYGGNFSGNTGLLCYNWNNDQRAWGWNSGMATPLNQWSFVALAIEPSQATLYVINTNGRQIAINAMSHVNQAFGGLGTIGTDIYSPVARVFNGLIDEVAIFDRTLSADEIQELYVNGFRLPEIRLTIDEPAGEDLIVRWPQGTLVEAPDPAGPWSVVSNALSPYHIGPPAQKKFYRVLVE